MIRQSITFIIISLVIFGVLYPMTIWGVGKLMPNVSNGKPIIIEGKLKGFENIAQEFSSENYFWSRPSAVEYDASSTGGSNYGPSNEVFLQEVSDRIESILQSHPEKTKAEIPIDMVTASGSGLDPYISLESALFQSERISNARSMDNDQLKQLILDHKEAALLGLFGPKDLVNVLKLNMALDNISPSLTNN
ncbi:potassium-transporting ATPase subunit KdpC [Belliella sp. DSM 111904]|uniref:Potassium-transporting ATPase KdpC subunit n=1 Tax=Belliella filtrata TaxID=2923435 RepID=A0ABS9V0T2_9BACT|nr:potassium-transporting ATPase subunit KdpC [Belliella filtrata]MCH7410012.1 potassium-transporting ATPase subunit KdpC [Belliella filtrata]